MYDNYSINLMWINSCLKAEQQFLCENTTRLIQSANSWAVAHPTATINIWYDSQTATSEQVFNTLQLIIHQEIKSRIKFKDIKEIEIVKNNQDLFDCQIPLYWRIDLLKLIIILDEVEKGGLDSALFADIRRGIINSREQLFGGNMEIALQRYGMLLANYGENQFHQLVKNPHMQIALKHFINMHFHAIQTILNFSEINKIYYKENDKIIFLDNPINMINKFYAGLNQVIHSTLNDIYNLYLAFTTKQSIFVPKIDSTTNEWVVYDFSNYDFIAKFYNPYYSAISSYSLIKENSDFFLLTINNKSIKYPIMMKTNFSCLQRNDLGSLSSTHLVDEPKPTTAVDKSNVFKCNLYEAANYNELPLFIIGAQKEILSDIKAISSQSKIQDARDRDSVVYNIQNSSRSTPHYKKYCLIS